MKIFDFIKGIAKRIETHRVVSDIRSTSAIVIAMHEGIPDVIELYGSDLHLLKSKTGKEIVEKLNKHIKAKLSSDKGYLTYLSEVLGNIEELSRELQKIAPATLGDIVDENNISYKKTEMLQTIAYYNFVLEYTNRFLDYITDAECDFLKGKPDVEKHWLEGNIPTYVDALKIFHEPASEVLSKIESIPRVYFDEDGAVEKVHGNALDPVGFRFIAVNNINLIFLLRTWFTDIAHSKYQRMGYEKKAIELKILYLRKKIRETGDESLAKVIHNYEQEIAIMASKIARYEATGKIV